MAPINRGFFTSAAVSLVLVAAASFIYLPSISDGVDMSVSPQVLGFVSVLIGVVLAAAIQQLTGYFTETSRKPVKDIGRSSLTGPATVILSGISLGLESAVYAALLIGGAVYGAFLIGGGAALYAVALAGCGLLTTAGVIVAMDTFGPVSDNAQGIAEMSGDIDDEGARVLTDLDAVGNTTKAITKGIAIATAVLAATALFGSYNAQIGVALDEAGETLGDAFSLVNPNNVVGAVLGAAVVFFFSGLAISAVSRAAGRVVFEVREQFRTKPGIMDYTERPDYSAVVDICTKDSLRELATPGLLAVLAPVAVGFGLGIGPLAAYLVGAIAAGTLMAVFLANSGGAWDNAKKMVEDGAYGGKGSEAHAATVIGDTVGDPFKDTAGPAINPLIKVMNLVALLIAPAVVGLSVGDDANTTAARAHRARRRAGHRGLRGDLQAPVGRRRRRPERHGRRNAHRPPLPDPTAGSSGRQTARPEDPARGVDDGPRCGRRRTRPAGPLLASVASGPARARDDDGARDDIAESRRPRPPSVREALAALAAELDRRWPTELARRRRPLPSPAAGVLSTALDGERGLEPRGRRHRVGARSRRCSPRRTAAAGPAPWTARCGRLPRRGRLAGRVDRAPPATDAPVTGPVAATGCRPSPRWDVPRVRGPWPRCGAVADTAADLAGAARGRRARPGVGGVLVRAGRA